MIEFLTNWWFSVIAMMFYLASVIFVGIVNEEEGKPDNRRLLGYLLLGGLLLPLPFLVSLNETEAGQYLSMLYFVYIGSIFIASYLRPTYCFLFNGFATVTKLFFFPRWNVCLLEA